MGLALLYATLGRYGLAEGAFAERPDDGLRLTAGDQVIAAGNHSPDAA